MKTKEEIIHEVIGILPGATDLTPMDYGECKKCMDAHAAQYRSPGEQEEQIKLLDYFADQVYKGYYVHKKDVEDVLEILDRKKVIEEFKKRNP